MAGTARDDIAGDFVITDERMAFGVVVGDHTADG
jgi:hypothetical protein